MTEKEEGARNASSCNLKTGCNGKGFNYCFWAKLIVGIPALFLIGWLAASFFANPFARWGASLIAIGGAVILARWVDRLPLFSGMVRKKT